METKQVKLNGKTYELKEPTIKSWSNVMRLKDILDEEQLYINMIAEICSVSKEELLKEDASVILEVGDFVYKFINQDSKQLYPEVELKGIKYKLVDVNNISFGQYVDLDSFLRKDETYRISNLNELAAYLYCEDGVEYSKSNIKKRIEEFKDLPIKYVESSLFFLLNLGRASQELIKLYSQSKFLWWIMRTRIALVLIGDGTKQLVRSQKTKFGRLIMWCLYPLLVVLITFRTLLTKTKKGKG